jgi:hypothetical protein
VTPAKIIQDAAADGVKLTLSPTGGIRYVGRDLAVSRWLPIIRQNKPALLAALVAANEPTRPATPADPEGHAEAERIARVASRLKTNPALRYAVDTHADIDGEEVILSVAIRGKGACEVRIPKSRYDGFRVLEAIEKHTRRETLQ